ncbi:DapH/DapD/GlmU-related protein [Clostridium botulinum]|uniref:DapH/DapD/GlmU-related protein n=1 Tax=Clostridium botulinum TaxID=1491 RepID=UPI001C9A682D|nr:DapH/DapD/GlmU-related protein [Clostridium botulinum]MBY6809139.1 carbonate dehydratase [Clostridium botulinum]MBY6822156.1 carbonate dehydratase [Clostridium botulinum]MBY6833054.1 carbonate dehydratase [Clostridium botulinum]MBY6972282.1 carbonate dehydratase [Clostridium botulinum]MCS6104664.1 carbonate dehydratase [Clostridium botulinum]
MDKSIKKNCEPTEKMNIYPYFIGKNPPTSFNAISTYPKIDKSVNIGPFSSVIGDVKIEKNVFVGCNVVLRADEGTPFYIGCNSNIQDGVIFHGLKDIKFYINGIKYSIYIGNKVSIAHRALIHGPAIVGNNAFVGFNAIVFNAIVEDRCYIDTGAIVTGGVRISENKYVPVGAIIDTQDKADVLLDVPSEQSDFTKKVIAVNVELSKAYDLKFGDTHCSCGICCNHNTLINN